MFCIKAKTAFSSGSDHIQNENGAHPVIAEALPQLGEEQCSEAARMTTDTASICGLLFHKMRLYCILQKLQLRRLHYEKTVDDHSFHLPIAMCLHFICAESNVQGRSGSCCADCCTEKNCGGW